MESDSIIICIDDASNLEKLQNFLTELGEVCETRRLEVKVSKSKVMRCNGDGGLEGVAKAMNDEIQEEFVKFCYLGVDEAV